MSKSIVYKIGLFSCLAILTACQSADLKVGHQESLTTPKGVQLKAFWPDQAALVAKMGEKDQEVLKKTQYLLSLFPQNPVKLLKEQIDKGWSEDADLIKSGLKSADLWEIIGEAPEMYVAVDIKDWAAEMAKIDTQDQIAIEQSVEKIAVVAQVIVENSEKLDKFLASAVENGNLKNVSQGSNTIYQIEGKYYLLKKDDLLVFANRLQLLEDGLNKIKDAKNITFDRPAFKMVEEQFGGSLAWVYLDYAQVIDLMAKNPELKAQLALAENGIQGVNPTDLESLILQVRPEDSGIKAYADVTLKNGALADLASKQSDLYLKDQVLGEKVLLYIESANFGSVLKVYDQILAKQPEALVYWDQVKSYLKEQGLDFEADLLPLFTAGNAVSLDADNGYIPNLQIYFDLKKGNAEKAKKLAKVINEAVDQAIQFSGVEPAQMSLFFNKKQLAEQDFWKGKFNFDLVAAAAPENLRKKLNNQKLEVYYGLNKNNWLTIALMPGLDEQITRKTVAQSGLDKVLKEIPGYRYEVSYFSLENALNYADRLVDLAAAFWSGI